MKRRFKKIVAMSMAAFMTLGLCHINVSAAVEDEEDIMPVASITANDVYVFENDTDNEGSYDVKPDHVIVTMLNDDVYEGSMQEVMDQLAEAYPEDTFDIDYELGGEDLADELEIGTYESTVWITYNGVDTEYGLYHFIVADNPILSFEVDDISIYYEDTEHRDEYNGENADWDAYRAFPISAAIVTSEKEYIGGIDDVIEDFKADYPDYRIDAFAHDDQSPDNKWSRANTYQAYYHLSSFDVPYDVYIADNPVVSTEVFTLTKYDTNIEEMFGYKNEETGEWVEGNYKGYNVWPDFKLILTDGSEYDSRNDGRVEDFIREKTGLNVSVYVESNQSPSNEWGAGEHYATIHIGDMVTDYIVYVVECPIQSMSVENINVLNGDTRLEVYTTWNQEIEQEEKHSYNRYNAIWPRKLSVTVDGSTYTGDPDEIRDTLREILGYEPDMHSNDGQSEGNEWVLGESYPVEFVIEGKSAEYTATVIDNPFEEVTVVSGCTVFAGTQEEINENGERFTGYRVYPDEIEVKVNGETYKSKDYPDLFRYLGDQVINACYNWGAYTDQSNDNIWETGEHEATFTVAGISTTFKVNVVENPIKSVTVKDKYCFDGCYDHRDYYDEENDTHEEFDAFNVWPDEISVTLNDDTVFTGNPNDVMDKIREKTGVNLEIHTEDEQTPSLKWEIGDHKAAFVIAGTPYEFNVKVVDIPIQSIEVDDIFLFEGDLITKRGYEDPETHEWVHDSTYQGYNTWPNEITITLKNGKVFKNSDGDLYEALKEEFGFDFPWSNNGDDQSPNNMWKTGEHEVTFNIAKYTAAYKVIIIPCDITNVTVNDLYILEGSQRTENGYWDGYQDFTGEWKLYDCYPHFITVETKDKTYSGDAWTVTEEYAKDHNYDVGIVKSYTDNGGQTPFTDVWEAGVYDVSFFFAGYTAGYKVNIIDNPIKSISVADMYDIEGTKFKYNEFDSERQQDIEFMGYSIIPMDITITFEDDSVYSGDPREINEYFNELLGFEPEMHFSSDQSDIIEWGPGEHFANLEIGGVEYTYKITIIENPIESFSIADVDVEYGDTVEDDHYWNPETGEVTEVTWNKYVADPEFTIVFKSGETLKGTLDVVLDRISEICEVDRNTIMNDFIDDQSPENVWDLGEHEVTFRLCGLYQNFKVNVIITESDLEITKQPVNASVNCGSKAIFSVTAECSNYDINYQWQFSSDNGVTWKNSGVTGNKTNTITVPVTYNLNGRIFRCIVTAGEKELITDSVKLTAKPIVSANPKSVSSNVGDTASFAIKSRSTVAKYQWEISKDGGKTWASSKLSGYDTVSISIASVPVTYNGFMFRCKVTNGTWTEYSTAATLTVLPTVIAEPENLTEYYGNIAKFYFKVSGPNLTYQWQVKNANGKWINSSSAGNDTAIIRFTSTSSTNNREFRCIVTSGNNKVISKTVKFNSKSPIITQPTAKSVKAGATAKFTVKAEGKNLSYQWQMWNGSKWVNSSATGAKTNTLSVAAKASLNGKIYRCVVTNGTIKTISNTAKLTVK